MALPVQRIPVRIARGTYANLEAARLAGDLLEGELCYATDESVLYTINSNTLRVLGRTNAVGSDVSAAGTGSEQVTNIVSISSTDYFALATPDADTLYMVY